MTPPVSVVITNYNYEKYIAECVASVLGQDFTDLEIVIVDDGSTDASRGVISSFKDPRIQALYKENGGMMSSFNAGFKASRGRIVVFLDADDYLTQGALTAHVKALAEPTVVRSQGYMAVVDIKGKPTGGRLPGRPAPEGDLRELALARGPGAFVSTPNSGNAWARGFLEQVFPLPEVTGFGAEGFLMAASPLFGKTTTLDRTVANYRVHGSSMSDRNRDLTLANMVAAIRAYETKAQHLASVARAAGYQVRDERWVSLNWRIVTMRYLVARHFNQGAKPTFRQHAKAVLGTSGNAAKRAALLGFLVAVRASPKDIAMALSQKLIKPHYM
jgi:glycosyltransferase involved in cell wall biosynthesis